MSVRVITVCVHVGLMPEYDGFALVKKKKKTVIKR